ncbi:MAG: putative membrane protein YdjX (TVP38/TMEM64 family) [Sulfitobacter sp.]|jgi:uncharacterized membrane protein YdjX (TVP38/TMEM64 family)|uniref:TVP38/TMEM64 family protein n=1 Tax=Sulfitobacter sp. TaxID=1903071 RepID=UPI0039E47C15
MSLRAAILAVLAILAVALLGIWLFAPSVFTEARALMDVERLDMLVVRAGIWGLVLIVTLMTVAVVASPIPSAPIAFGLARILGQDVLRRVFGDRVDAGLLGSQDALTLTVFASRLMPFVSFDMISYAAGLSRLHVWRFALATLAGIIPASFLLAHFGGETVSGELGRATWAVLGLGLVTGLPMLWLATRRKTQKEI